MRVPTKTVTSTDPAVAEEQDQAEVTDGRAEGDAHRRPRGAENAVGQPQNHETTEGQHIGAPVRCAGGRESWPALLSHCSM